MEVPRNAGAYFAFGVLWVGFAGFWTGGAHRQTQEATKAVDALARGKAQADGWVWFTYDVTEGSGYDVGYNFRTPTGQIFTGSFPSNRRYPTGAEVRVAYATSDPMVSYEIGRGGLDESTFPIEWFGLAMGLLGLFLMGKYAMDQANASSAVKRAFVFVASAAYVGGAVLGLGQTWEKYTLQVGEEAWSSASFDNESYISGPPVKLSNGGLTVDGRSYGPVPDHAHVWIRDDGVYVNGQLVQ